VGAKLFTSSMSLLIAVFSFHITGTDSFEGGKYVGWVFLLVCLAILSTFFVYPGVEHVQGLLKSIGEDMQKYPNRM
jgi:hypothetical protein